MGDPKKAKKKFSKPSHPWQKTRIEEEKVLTIEYGLVNKRELWKASSTLKRYKDQSKKLAALSTPQSEKERTLLLKKLYELSLIEKNATVDDILGLTTKNILERRLQTIIFRKALAGTIKQARQFIVHRHILVNNGMMTVPSYLVKRAEENSVAFVSTSPFFSQDHPERTVKRDPKKVRKHYEKPKQRRRRR